MYVSLEKWKNDEINGTLVILGSTCYTVNTISNISTTGLWSGEGGGGMGGARATLIW